MRALTVVLLVLALASPAAAQRRPIRPGSGRAHLRYMLRQGCFPFHYPASWICPKPDPHP